MVESLTGPLCAVDPIFLFPPPVPTPAANPRPIIPIIASLPSSRLLLTFRYPILRLLDRQITGSKSTARALCDVKVFVPLPVIGRCDDASLCV